MRIGIVTGEFPPMVGGVGAYSQILANELSRQGHYVSIFSSQAAQHSESQIQVHNAVKRWSVRSLLTIRTWANTERLDIVNLQFQTAAFGMSPWIHFLPDVMQKTPVVTTFHDLRFPYLFPKAGRLRDWIVMHLATASDGVIVTNHEDQQSVSQLSKATLIPIGSNILNNLPMNFDAVTWREKAGAQSSDFLLAYFGLFNRSKGLETLIESVSQLRAESIPARLVMIGGGAGTSDPTNETFMREFNQQIKSLNLTTHVQQTGFLDEASVSGYLAASDAVVLPFSDGASYRRGSLMAAIRYGCAIVTTIPQVAVSTFQDGDNMLLVEPGNARNLAQAIKRVRESSELHNRLRKGAAELAQAFAWPEIARAMTDFYRWVIEESPSP